VDVNVSRNINNNDFNNRETEIQILILFKQPTS